VEDNNPQQGSPGTGSRLVLLWLIIIIFAAGAAIYLFYLRPLIDKAVLRQALPGAAD
jgi:hypothetical protein